MTLLPAKLIDFDKLANALDGPGIYEIWLRPNIALKVGIASSLRKRLTIHMQSLQRRLKLKRNGHWSRPDDVLSKGSILAKHLYFDGEIAPNLNLKSEGDRQVFLRKRCEIRYRETGTREAARKIEITLEQSGAYRYVDRVRRRRVRERCASR